MTRRPVPLMCIVMVLGIGTAGCAGTDGTGETDAPRTPGVTSSPPTDDRASPARLRPTRVVATGLDAPWSLVFVGGTPLVSERDTGRVLELADDGSTRTVGVVPGVEAGGEGGLLGLAVDGSSRLFAYSTGADGNRVQRFALEGRPGSLRLGAAQTIVDGIASSSYHNGGRIAFGPDGMLYVATGDAGRSESAQDPQSLSGKILRMTPDGQIPQDNPSPDSLIYTSGHRNVQGLAWSGDGTMFATEFGQDEWDELNVVTPGGNYGWPEVEGAAGEPEYADPVQQWAPADASPSGMTVVDGNLVIANLRGEVLRTVPAAHPAVSAESFAGQYGRIRDVVATPEGRLWLLTNNTDGRGTPARGDDRIIEVEATR